MSETLGPVLSATGLRKDYGGGESLVQAVRDVSLSVAAGESVAIVGPSGCGKSSLLYLLGALERPTAGTLRLDGQKLTVCRRRGSPGYVAASSASCSRHFTWSTN